MDLFHEMYLWKVLWQCGQVIVIVLFPFSGPRKAERDEHKKRPLPMSLFQAPEKALSKTREEVRAFYARSLLHVSLDEFSQDSEQTTTCRKRSVWY